ncbi:MAG: tetratricopeptide repeat protein, partial [Chitinophagales bacterium]
LTASHLLQFIPNGANLDQTKPRNQKLLNSLRSIIADAATVHSAATYILEYEDWDFMGVYYDAIDHFGHGFMKFHPPKIERVTQEDYEMWNHVVTAGYIYHDMMLGRLLELAGEDTTVMLVSDHGFHPDHLRPKAIPKEPAGPAAEHSPYGIIVMRGPDIKKDELIHGASLIDVTPTLLHVFGLPVGKDMDGKVLANAFETPPKIKTIPSWEDVQGECGMHPKDMQIDPYAAKAALEQLVALGYIDPPGDNAEEAIKRTTDENNFYLARSYIDGGKTEEAIPILKGLFEDNPEALRYGVRLANCYLRVGETALARNIVQNIRKTQKEPTSGLYVLQGKVMMREKKYRRALQFFQKAEELTNQGQGLMAHIGGCYTKLEQWQKALNAYQKELEIDPEAANAYLGCGIAFLQLQRYEEAIDYLFEAIGLQFHYPAAHYYLGETLFHLKQYEQATNAFEISLRLAPGMIRSRKWLVDIYENHLNHPSKAAEHKEHIPDETRPEILIVSGLPRSGTSMMMQMMVAGGFEAFTDGKRSADENNKKGYYEHDAVKGLLKNHDFLAEIGDKVVKIIANLLMVLPQKYRYRIIFMERDLDEVLSSQHRMLMRQNKASLGVYPLKLAQNFRDVVEKVKNTIHYRPNVQVLFVSHSEVIENPLLQARRIGGFLEKELEVEAMAAVVDRSLHRERLKVQ